MIAPDKPKPRSKPFVRVRRLVRDTDQPTAKVFMEFECRSIDGRRISILVPNGLRDFPNRILARLRDDGAALPEKRDALPMIENSLARIDDLPVVDHSRRTGWNGASFVLPGKTIGDRAYSLVYADVNTNGRVEEIGNLEGWKTGLKNPCSVSSILTFAIAAAFAAPLMAFSGMSEGVIFLLVGASGTGKTTACRAAMSVYGATDIDLIPTFDLTDRALEEICVAFNDTLLVLDEVGRAGTNRRARETALGKIAYAVPSGVGRKRAAMVQDQGLHDCVWRTLVLGSSEDSFYNGERADERKTGEKVRLVEIAVPSADDGGIFYAPKLGPSQRVARGRAMSAAVEETIRAHHGCTIAPFVEGLLHDHARLPRRIGAMIDEFKKSVSATGDTSFEARLAAKFGLICAGGRLAARFNLAPFTEKRCERACRRLFRRAVTALAPKPPLNERAFAKALLEAAKDERRVPRVEEGRSVPPMEPEPWGIRRIIDRVETIAIRRENLGRITGQKISEVFLGKLSKIGGLMPAKDGKYSRQIKVTGWQGSSRPRFYCFKADAIRKLAES